VTRSEVQAVASNWAGDRYIAWDQGSKSCVRTSFLMRGSAATADLLSALRKFAGDHPGTTVAGAGPVLFTACA